MINPDTALDWIATVNHLGRTAFWASVGLAAMQVVGLLDWPLWVLLLPSIVAGTVAWVLMLLLAAALLFWWLEEHARRVGRQNSEDYDDGQSAEEEEE